MVFIKSKVSHFHFIIKRPASNCHKMMDYVFAHDIGFRLYILNNKKKYRGDFRHKNLHKFRLSPYLQQPVLWTRAKERNVNKRNEFVIVGHDTFTINKKWHLATYLKQFFLLILFQLCRCLCIPFHSVTFLLKNNLKVSWD